MDTSASPMGAWVEPLLATILPIMLFLHIYCQYKSHYLYGILKNILRKPSNEYEKLSQDL